MEEGPEEDSEVERGKARGLKGDTGPKVGVWVVLCWFGELNCFRHTESEIMVN